MRKAIAAVTGTLVLAAMAAGLAVTPAAAHHPSWLWHNGEKYYLSDTYRQGYCFYHHDKWIYCKRGSSSY
jgi:hypothetical protein